MAALWPNVGVSTASYPNALNLNLGTLVANGYSSYNEYSPARTNVAGQTTLWLFPAANPYSYTLKAVPPAASGFGPVK